MEQLLMEMHFILSRLVNVADDVANTAHRTKQSYSAQAEMEAVDIRTFLANVEERQQALPQQQPSQRPKQRP